MKELIKAVDAAEQIRQVRTKSIEEAWDKVVESVNQSINRHESKITVYCQVPEFTVQAVLHKLKELGYTASYHTAKGWPAETEAHFLIFI